MYNGSSSVMNFLHFLYYGIKQFDAFDLTIYCLHNYLLLLFFTSANSPSDTWLAPRGFYRCGHRQCKACNFAHVTREFVSSHTGETFPIRRYINCNSRNVIFLITCKVCNLQYVGCTTTSLKTRIRRHLSDAGRPMAVGASMVSRHCQAAHAGSTNSLVASKKLLIPYEEATYAKRFSLENLFGF